jgi:hypothetical protein
MSRATPFAVARRLANRMPRRPSRKRSAKRRTRTRSRPSIGVRRTPVGRDTAHPHRHPLTAATASAGRSRLGWTPRRARSDLPRPSGNRHRPHRGSAPIHHATTHLARCRRTTRTTPLHGASRPRRMRRRAGRIRARCRCNRPTRTHHRVAAIPASSRRRLPHRTNRRAGRIPGSSPPRSRRARVPPSPPCHQAKYSGAARCPSRRMPGGAGHSRRSSAARTTAVAAHSRLCQMRSRKAVHTPPRPIRAGTTPPDPARSRRVHTSAGRCHRFSGAASSPIRAN